MPNDQVPGVFEFTPEEKSIFQYHDGEKAVYADPLAISRQKKYIIPDANALISQWRRAENLAAKDVNDYKFSPEEIAEIRMGQVAHEELIRCIQKVFGLPEFDPATGKGATAAMTIRVWNHYNEWLEKKSGSTPSEPTSPAATPEQ